LMAAILDLLPYPATLLARTVGRCRAEQSVWPIRAALIKASLNRRSPAKEVTVNLDADDSNVGSRLGRLFAVLENIQRRAQRDLNVTIRDRYFAAAMTAPRSVFPQLMRLKNSHLKKLYRVQETRGLAIHFEHQIDQILSPLPETPGLPASLSLEDQGRFILGYHHQRNFRSGGKADDRLSDIADLDETEITQQGD
jgi:CRISPR-associated protein Csd1